MEVRGKFSLTCSWNASCVLQKKRMLRCHHPDRGFLPLPRRSSVLEFRSQGSGGQVLALVNSPLCWISLVLDFRSQGSGGTRFSSRQFPTLLDPLKGKLTTSRRRQGLVSSKKSINCFCTDIEQHDLATPKNHPPAPILPFLPFVPPFSCGCAVVDRRSERKLTRRSYPE